MSYVTFVLRHFCFCSKPQHPTKSQPCPVLCRRVSSKTLLLSRIHAVTVANRRTTCVQTLFMNPSCTSVGAAFSACWRGQLGHLWPRTSGPKRTRLKKKQIEAELYKYGSGGRNGLYRNCFVCQRIGSNRSLTKEYCDQCKVPVCSSRHIKTSKEGEAYVCRNELHSNAKICEAAKKKA